MKKWLLIALALRAVPACADDTDFTGIGQANTKVPSDSCRYADPAAVEKLVGEKLAAPPFNANSAGPEENGTTCRFLFNHFRSFDIDVSQQGGDKLFEILTGITTTIDRKSEQKGNLDKILALEGDWDEVRMVGADKMAALQGDKLVLASTHGLLLSQENVAKLVEGVYAQLDKPQGPKGGDGLAAAQAIYAKRPGKRDACDVLSDADIRAALGRAPASRKSYGASCDFSFGPSSYAGLKISWSGGFSEMAMIAVSMGAHAATGIQPAAGMETLKAEADAPLPPTWTGSGRSISNPAWDAGFAGSTLLGATRADVFVALSIASTAFTPRQEVALLAVALKNAAAGN